MATGRRGIARGGVDGVERSTGAGARARLSPRGWNRVPSTSRLSTRDAPGTPPGTGCSPPLVWTEAALASGSSGRRKEPPHAASTSSAGKCASRASASKSSASNARNASELAKEARASSKSRTSSWGAGGSGRNGRGRAPNGERARGRGPSPRANRARGRGEGGRARDGVDARARGGVGRDAGRLRGHSRRRSRVARDTRVGHARQRERVCARASAPSTRRNRLETPLHHSNLRAQPPRKRRIVVVGRSKPRRRLDADVRPAQRSNTSRARNQPEFETSKERAPESGSVGEIFFSLFEDWLAGDL